MARRMLPHRDMKTIQTLCALSLTTLGPLLACGGAGQEPPTTANSVESQPASIKGTSVESRPGITSAQSVDKSVVYQLATARWDQEQTCNNIGPKAKFASRDVCMDQMKGSIGNDLDAYNCPRGIDRDAANRCMAAITSEECTHPFDTLTRYDKCRTGALCMK
jgi:hypothetical protein